MKNKMGKNTLSNSINPIVMEAVNGLAFPVRCTISKVYENNHVDVLVDGKLLRYVETVGGTPVIMGTGVLLFLNNSFEDYVVIV